MVAFPTAFRTTFELLVPFEYTTVAFGVPEIVKVVAFPAQSVEVPEMVAVGKAFTVTVVVCEQPLLFV